MLARALGRNRHDIVISTKAGYDFYRPVIDPDERGKSQRWTPGFIRYACEQSLRRLDTDYIDLFQLHHPGPDVIEDDELFGLLDDLVREGKTRYYGVTLDPKPESKEAGEGAIDLRNVSAVQLEFSLLDQQPARSLISRAQGSATAIVAYDPSASGVLEAEITRTAAAMAGESGEMWTIFSKSWSRDEFSKAPSGSSAATLERGPSSSSWRRRSWHPHCR